MPILCIECPAEATHTCRVVGGPTIHLCQEHAFKMQAACKEAGVASKIEVQPTAAEGESR
jgi:hypothetical protein